MMIYQGDECPNEITYLCINNNIKTRRKTCVYTCSQHRLKEHKICLCCKVLRDNNINELPMELDKMIAMIVINQI